SSAGSSANSSPVGTIKKNANGDLLSSSTTPVLTNGDASCELLNAANNNNLIVDNNGHNSNNGLAIYPDLEVYEEIEDDLEKTGVSLQVFIENLNIKGRKGLCDEYYYIKMTQPTGTFEMAKTRV